MTAPTFRSASTVSGLTITAPSGAAQGDLLLLTVITQGFYSGAPGMPAGWQTVLFGSFGGGSSANDLSMFVAFKVATGTEPASYTFTQTGGVGSFFVGSMSAYTGCATSDPVIMCTSQANSGATSLPVGGIGSFGGLTSTVVAAYYGAGPFTPAASFTARVTQTYFMLADAATAALTPAATNAYPATSGSARNYSGGAALLLRPSGSTSPVAASTGVSSASISVSNTTGGTGTAGPAGPTCIPGDTLIASILGGSGATAPAGWTMVQASGAPIVSGQGEYLYALARTADGTTTDNLQTASFGIETGWIVVSGAGMPNVASAASGSGATMTTAAMTVPDTGEAVLSLFAFGETGTSTPTASTPTGTTGQYGVVNGPDGANNYYYYQSGSFEVQATAGTSTARSATTSPTSSGWVAHALALPGNTTTAPNAPTLDTPTNSAYVDVTSGVSLVGTYNSTDAANQNAYACRIKVSGAASYSYYNAATNALQSTVVWNPVSTTPAAQWTVTLPAAAVSDGNTYNWSLASQEANANLQGPFAADFTFNAQAAPTLTVTGPAGSETTTTSPTVTWTTTPGTGAVQTTYQVIVEHGAYSTTPGSGTQDWTSGVVNSGNQSAQVGVVLSNSVTYRAFVQVAETGGLLSPWRYTTFTVSLDAPAAPTISVTTVMDPSGVPCLAVTVNGHDNILSADDASFEGGIGTWGNGGQGTIAQTSAAALDGAKSALLTFTTGAQQRVFEGYAGNPVQGGGTYTAMAFFRAATTPRDMVVQVEQFDSTGAYLGVAGTSPATTDTTTGWTKAVVVCTLATAAAFARIQSGVYNNDAANNEQHYMDEAGIFPGTVTSWTRGGLAGTTTATVTYTDASPYGAGTVRGATALPLPTPSQQVTVNDREATPGIARTYTATVTATV